MKEELNKVPNCEDSFKKYIFLHLSAPCFGFEDTEP